jgi:hypothetical protein
MGPYIPWSPHSDPKFPPYPPIPAMQSLVKKFTPRLSQGQLSMPPGRALAVTAVRLFLSAKVADRPVLPVKEYTTLERPVVRRGDSDTAVAECTP